MTITQVLLRAWAAGLVFERRGNELTVRSLTPTAQPELLALMRSHKAQLRRVFTNQSTTRIS